MSFTDFQQKTKVARGGSEQKRTDLKTAKQKADNLKRRKEHLMRKIAIEERYSNDQLDDVVEQEQELEKTIAESKASYDSALSSEWATLMEYQQFTSPVENIAGLPDDCPILLFPLRLETRFKKVQYKNRVQDQLWVRVFPDDIAINSFESDLSKSEIRDAQAYWLARWSAGKEIDGNRGAWRSLTAAHGPGRAYWLISNDNYVPVNLSEEPEKNTGEIILTIGTENPLAEPERRALSAYWSAFWKADKDNTQIEQARSVLLEQISEERANKLLKDYKPANLKDPSPAGLRRDEVVVRVEFVIFKSTTELESKLHSWSQPSATSVLPERFVFLAYHNSEQDMPPQLGNLVPPRLVLGPDPAAEPGEDLRLANEVEAAADPDLQESDLIFAENMRWMFDFEEAVAKGMGFKINLTPEQAKRGFDRVIVLGLKLSADQSSAQALLEELFTQHQYSRKGLAIVRQGTPTNNTEDDNSGYSWRHDPDESFDVYFGDAINKSDPHDWYNKRDGRWLAEMLGVDPGKLNTVENYFATDISEAKAMQQALWPATMGHFMDSMMNPVFSAETIEQTRQFFTRHVSGRGNLPAIRVGKQPYGILPACNYTNMEWLSPSKDKPALSSGAASLFGSGNLFFLRLYQVLLDMDKTWAQLVDKVACVGKDGDPHQLLLDIIGLHPNSVELQKRYANSLKQLHNTYNIEGVVHGGLFSYYPASYSAAAALLAQYGYTIDDRQLEPDIFKKSFFNNSYFLSGDRIDSVPVSEVEALGLCTSDEKNYINWLIKAAETSHDRLRKQEGFIDDKPPTALLYLLLYHSLDLSYIDTSLKLHLSNNVLNAAQMRQAYVEPDFIHVEANNETESRWKYLYKKDVRITANTDISLERYIAQNIYNLNEAAAFRDVLAGMRRLAGVPTARLERAMMEHIDTVSYRYDAWMLGFMNLQLEYMRNLQENDAESPPRRGIYIGAYGWLEDLRPEDKVLRPVTLPDELAAIFNPDGDLVEDASNGGYILAPSQNHAVTAAVLRNGHLSNDDPENREELKIKLTSDRVRLALQIIEGIQGGQRLAAMLGYQFERGLHDHTDVELDKFIFDLRNAFPLVAKKFKDTTPNEEDSEYESIDQIEAKNVLDGEAFLEHIQKAGNANYPFGLMNLPSATEKQTDAIDQEVRKLIDINDAVADLAMAESVHQVVQGNYERAAATLETYSKGNYPSNPDVIQTPRSGNHLTHRVALQFRTGLSHNLGDAGVTPRMVAEPGVHDWLDRIMPKMDEIVCVASFIERENGENKEEEISLAKVSMAAIDTLYLLNIDSDQAMSGLDDLITHYVFTEFKPVMDQAVCIEYTRKLDTAKFSVFEVASWIASLRDLLLKSRPLNATDVRLANEVAKENEQSLSLDPDRLQSIIKALDDLRTNELQDYITELKTLIAADDFAATVNKLDGLLDNIVRIFLQVSSCGIPQTGIGFVYQWQQGMYKAIYGKMEELITRWENRRSEYFALRDEYIASIDSLSDEELFTLLQQAELKISSVVTAPLPATPADLFAIVDDTKFLQFEDMLTNSIRPTLKLDGLTPLLQRVQILIGQLPLFDLVGLDVEEQLSQVRAFVDGLLGSTENLGQELLNRKIRASDLLGTVTATLDALNRVEIVKNAGKAIFGDDFLMVPQFMPDTFQGKEWQNAMNDSDHTLRYLLNELDKDFPMDDWLYGLSRVREKLYHLENTLFHIEGFTNASLQLIPSQFPYRPDDYWLGLEYPEKKPGTEDAFTIDEDKLLFTGIYTEPFDPARPQCGLLLDEWTEVIPSREETLGLTFHYDQPNSEPPQTLLLATPSDFTGHWRWDDLVNTLHETLEMAKKRAVEPEHVDMTVYNRFLPPIVSLASPLPLTATLNLALNNQVFYKKVFDDE